MRPVMLQAPSVEMTTRIFCHSWKIQLEKLCIYIEHSFTSVPIKHRNIDKVEIEDISFPTETDYDVEVQHALMSIHVKSN